MPSKVAYNLSLALAAMIAASGARAQTAPPAPPAQPPPFATTKVPGTENVYVFRYQGYQAMFVVTPAGVIATDPIGYQRPQAVTTYIDEIRKVTKAPIKYLVYSHHHYDHIAGGAPFKAAGATVVAHRNAKTHLDRLRMPDVVPVDEVVGDDGRVIELGGMRVELHYVGRNHSDNSLVLLLPRQRILFTVDFIPIETLHWRDMPDSFLPDWFDSSDAVRDGGLFAVDGSGLFSRPGPRIVEGIATLAELFDPEGFAGSGPSGSWIPLGPVRMGSGRAD